MFVNFTDNYQFHTRLQLKNKNVDCGNNLDFGNHSLKKNVLE